MAITFRAGYWNIGVEGQLLKGAVAAAGIGLLVHGLPTILVIPLMVAGGAFAGAAWALVPALLRVRMGIDDVVTAPLLNPLALLVVQALLQGPWKDPETGSPESPRIAEAAEFPRLSELVPFIDRSRLHLGCVIAGRHHHPGLVDLQPHQHGTTCPRRRTLTARGALRRHQGRTDPARRRTRQWRHRRDRRCQRGGWHPVPSHRGIVAWLRLHRHRGRHARRAGHAGGAAGGSPAQRHQRGRDLCGQDPSEVSWATSSRAVLLLVTIGAVAVYRWRTTREALPYLVVILALALSGRNEPYPGAYLKAYRRN